MLDLAGAREEAPGTISQNDSSVAENSALSGSNTEELSTAVSSDITSLHRSIASCSEDYV
jgi:hypothetical protein